MSIQHPARALAFGDLCDGLDEAQAKGLIARQCDPSGLELFIYTRACVYDRQWTPFSLMARGLIIDRLEQRVVATPFPKFFNVGERGEDTIPALPFEVFEKLDGSLIIIFWHGGEWRAATKGSFRSEQATWAARYLATSNLGALSKGATYLAEAIYPENRIVIPYTESGLVLLAAYAEDGHELTLDDIQATAGRLGWRTAKRYPFSTVAALIDEAKTLPATEEGFVLRFANGLRLKVKGEEYRRIHALVSRVTPLALWEAMQAGDDMTAIRRDLPEEFWTDFDTIRLLLQDHVDDLMAAVAESARGVEGLSDKEVGLRLDQFPDRVRRLVFPYRKSAGQLLSDLRSRRVVFQSVRPTRNELAGYQPSGAVARLAEEAA